MQNGEYSHLDPNSNQSYKVYISEDHQRKVSLEHCPFSPPHMHYKEVIIQLGYKCINAL